MEKKITIQVNHDELYVLIDSLHENIRLADERIKGTMVNKPEYVELAIEEKNKIVRLYTRIASYYDFNDDPNLNPEKSFDITEDDIKDKDNPYISHN